MQCANLADDGEKSNLFFRKTDFFWQKSAACCKKTPIQLGGSTCQKPARQDRNGQKIGFGPGRKGVRHHCRNGPGVLRTTVPDPFLNQAWFRNDDGGMSPEGESRRSVDCERYERDPAARRVSPRIQSADRRGNQYCPVAFVGACGAPHGPYCPVGATLAGACGAGETLLGAWAVGATLAGA